MNFCSECGTKLTDGERSLMRCCNGHSLSTAVEIVGSTEIGPVKPTRKLPTNDEERAAAYCEALTVMEAFFKKNGFESYVSDGGTLMVGRGPFLLDAKIVPNDGRTAYVTSGPGYNPTKAGTKESGATVITSRTLMKASTLLRVSVTNRMSAKPVFVELRKNIQDPLAHICKSIMFVLQDALDPHTSIGREIRDVSALKDVPPEWLPKPGDHDLLFGLPQEDMPMLEPPK